MENKIENNTSLFKKTSNWVIKNKFLLLCCFSLLIISLIGLIYYNYHQINKNKTISEKFIKAGIYLTSKNKDKSKDIYLEIILSKNKFYSILALNQIIENNLIENNDQILELFTKIENVISEKSQKNLLYLKKSLYLIKIDRTKEGHKILKEIISSNSIWKDTALEILK
jgi:predicted negative regulator of RcsB-dependent stress response